MACWTIVACSLVFRRGCVKRCKFPSVAGSVGFARPVPVRGFVLIRVERTRGVAIPPCSLLISRNKYAFSAQCLRLAPFDAANERVDVLVRVGSARSATAVRCSEVFPYGAFLVARCRWQFRERCGGLRKGQKKRNLRLSRTIPDQASINVEHSIKLSSRGAREVQLSGGEF